MLQKQKLVQIALLLVSLCFFKHVRLHYCVRTCCRAAYSRLDQFKSRHTSGDGEGLNQHRHGFRRLDGAKVQKLHRNHFKAKRDFFMKYIINKQTSEQLMRRSNSLCIVQSYLKKHANQTTCSPYFTVLPNEPGELMVSHCGFQCAFQELPHGFSNHVVPGLPQTSTPGN